MPLMRLDKFFSSQNLASRKEIKSVLKNGLIQINGVTASKPECKVDPEQDLITWNGQPVAYQKHLYLMLNKPQGVVSATNDTLHKTVLDLVPDEWKRPGLFPAGRLDKDTTGLVLITDDGDFAHRILSPKNHVEKTYLSRIEGEITEKAIRMFAQGVTLRDGFECLPAQIKVLEGGDCPLVEITICEGKYHQIKRMVASVGGHVLTLQRIRIGSLMLDETLPEGTCRKILHKEIDHFL